MGLGAFGQCKILKSVVVSEDMAYIPQRCFMQCTSAETVSLPSILTKLYSYLFEFCSALENIYLPDSLYFIGQEVFAGIPIANITIP